MSTSSCSEKTSRDTLLNGRVLLLQPKEGYRAAIDPVLLAAAISAKNGQNAVELGLGAGAAALCLLERVPAMAGICGLEIDPGQVELAHRNAALNKRENQLQIILGDAAQPPRSLPRNHFDHVFMNPPYLESSRHDAPASARKASAHVETGEGFETWIRQAGKLLKPKGWLTLIHRADALDRILAALSPAFGGILLCPLWPRAGEPAKRVIVAAQKGGRAPCRLLPGLVLHDAKGYTIEADAILRGGASIDLGR
ncbi:MAG: methyltransferase [Rhodospirillales bacterium]|nr:methyltransferase [Rhodospirillales bacterium]